VKQSINKSQFAAAVMSIRPDNFSRRGLVALFDYLEDYEESTGEELELDVIALCCEFSEFENLEEFQENYGADYETMEDIENETTVIRIDSESFIVQNF
jgi:hypothetical protein